MGIFRRGPGVPARVPSSAPDETFPYWSAEEAQRFRAMVRTALAEAGVEATVYADYAQDAGGRQFGLGNIAARCSRDERGERGWPAAIGDHVRRMLAATEGPHPFQTLPRSGILAATYLRLIGAGDVGDNKSYARPVAAGLAEVLNLDRPETVAYFTDDQVSQFGYPELRAAGLANLRTVRPDERQTLRRDGGTIEVLAGDSLFTASLLLVLEDVLAGYGLAADPAFGVFAAVPTRHLLALHVPAGAAAVPSLNMLAGFAAAEYRDAAGTVSPDVYWWRPGGIRRISELTPDGVQIQADEELLPVLEALIRR